MAFPLAAVRIKTREPGRAAKIPAGTRRITRQELVEALGLFPVLALCVFILDKQFGQIEVEVAADWVLVYILLLLRLWFLSFVLAALSSPPSRHFV